MLNDPTKQGLRMQMPSWAIGRGQKEEAKHTWTRPNYHNYKTNPIVLAPKHASCYAKPSRFSLLSFVFLSLYLQSFRLRKYAGIAITRCFRENSTTLPVNPFSMY